MIDYRGKARTLLRKIRLQRFRWQNRDKQRFICPICSYRGPFQDINPVTGLRKHARCPNCGSLERHRLQYLVVEAVLKNFDSSQKRMLHFAPEPFLKNFFQRRFGGYETADLHMEDVDHTVDIQELPFADDTYDFVFASHVLEHIPDDMKAIQEIHRILRPGGMAILPVPLVCEETVEYPAPSPYESDHVRAPGFDYFARYELQFSRVAKYDSESFAGEYQLFVHEDRSRFPNERAPLRPAMVGERHIDIVPVCYV